MPPDPSTVPPTPQPRTPQPRTPLPLTATARRRAAEMIGDKGLRGRRLLKRFLYSQMSLRSALMIALGREQPLVRFTVEADPPSIYLVFAIREDCVESLPARLDLPTEVDLCPLRCVPGDDPTHYLTLNIYRVSGITTGVRAEWSVYVADREAPTTPRYLVIDARSSTVSMDPVHIITPKSTVEHHRDGLSVTSTVGDRPDQFRVELQLPEGDGHEPVTTAPEWAGANDLIYWGNGIRDRTFYDAGMADPVLWDLDPGRVQITDDSPWAEFVEPEPRHVLVYRDAIELVIQPWENVGTIGH